MTTDLDAARAKRITGPDELALLRAALQEQGLMMASLHEMVVRLSAKVDAVFSQVTNRSHDV